MFQILDNRAFEGDNAKKGIKSRLTVHDGVSSVAIIVTEKALGRIDDADWKMSFQKYSILRIMGRHLQVNKAGTKK